MAFVKSQVAKLIHLFGTDSLFRNATYLMGSTAIMSVLGFGFWLFVAHLYSASDIGLASALISITLLISNLSLLGLNSGLVRFLPGSKNQSRDINAALLTVGGSAMAAALCYLVIERLAGGHLSIFIGHMWTWPIFMVLMAAVALNTLTDAVFIANRKAEYHTMVYTSFGVVKLFLPLVLIPLASLGIFIAYIASVVVSLILSLYFMWRKCGYVIRSKPNWRLIPDMQKYAASNYVGVILAGMPSQLLPSIIIATLGSPKAAFFSMAWTMANLLYVIPSSITQSLMAESSHNMAGGKNNLSRAAKILVVVLIPTIALAIVVAPFLLRIFGPTYASNSLAIFQIMAISTIFIAINAVAGTILNLAHRSFGIVIAQGALAAVSLGSAVWLVRYGLIGIGIAMMLGYIAANMVYLGIFLIDNLRKHSENKDARNRQTESTQLLKPAMALYNIFDFDAQPLAVGSSNQTFLVMSGPEKYVLRLYNPVGWTMEQIERELHFINYLAGNGVPVTKTINNKFGDKISNLASLTGTTDLILMEYAAGSHLDKATPGVIRDMANIQARIHNYGLAYSETLDPLVLKEEMHIRQRIMRRLSLLAFTPHAVSHFDYDLTNILIQGDNVSCVLDFEGMRHDSLLICIVYTLSQVYDSQSDLGVIEYYLESYQAVRSLTTLERLLLRFALAYRLRSPRCLMLRY